MKILFAVCTVKSCHPKALQVYCNRVIVGQPQENTKLSLKFVKRGRAHKFVTVRLRCSSSSCLGEVLGLSTKAYLQAGLSTNGTVVILHRHGNGNGMGNRKWDVIYEGNQTKKANLNVSKFYPSQGSNELLKNASWFLNWNLLWICLQMPYKLGRIFFIKIFQWLMIFAPNKKEVLSMIYFGKNGPFWIAISFEHWIYL